MHNPHSYPLHRDCRQRLIFTYFRDGPSEKLRGGGWGKNQKKIHARENAKKKNYAKKKVKKKLHAERKVQL